MTRSEFADFVKKNRWVWAKTYEKFAPHEYVVRGKCYGNDEMFYDACRYILDNGMRMFYYQKERKYLIFDGRFYWIMGDVVNEDRKIINRCLPEDYDIVFMRRGTQKGKSARKEPKYEQLSFEDVLQRE